MKAQEQDPSARELSFLERFGLLVDQQWNWRENQALSRLLKNAKLRTPNACVEEIDYHTARGLDKLSASSALPPLRSGQVSLGEAEHFTAQSRSQRRYARMVFGIIPECRSDSSGMSVQLHRNPQNPG